MIKNLKIKNKKINEAKIVKTGLFPLIFIPVILTGCNSVNTKDYYLVCENSKYYICKNITNYNYYILIFHIYSTYYNNIKL